MNDSNNGSRLPPPAFPPGSRKQAHRNRAAAPSDSGLGDGYISPDDPMPARDRSMDSAFISPDDPMPTGLRSSNDAAFISPDDPIPHRAPVTRSEDDFPSFDMSDSDAVVTGMGDDAHLDPEELVTGGDPFVIDLVLKVSKLGEALRKKGEAGLRVSGDMDRFEATLRGYCVGYLVGRRAEESAPPPEL